MLRHECQEVFRPRRTRKRDLAKLRERFGTGSGFRGASTGLERRDGGDNKGNNGNGDGDGNGGGGGGGGGNGNGNGNGNNNNNNNNNKGNDDKGNNNRKDSDTKSKDQSSTISVTSTSSLLPPPPPPPPPTSVVVSSVTSILVTTATLTTIDQTSSAIGNTPAVLTLTPSSTSIDPPSTSSETTSATVTSVVSSTDVFSSTEPSNQNTTPAPSFAPSASGTQVLATTATIATDTANAASIAAESSTHGSKHHGLSKGTQAGIAVGVICFVLLLAVGALHLILRRRRRREESSEISPETSAPSRRSRLENVIRPRASTPEMAGPVVAELDGSVAGSTNRRNHRRSISVSSFWAPSSVSSRSRTSVSELGKDAISEAGSYREREYHTSSDMFTAGLAPPPSAARGHQYGSSQDSSISAATLDSKFGLQLARSDSGASAPGASTDAPGFLSHKPQESSLGSLKFLSIFPEKRSSRTVRNSVSGTRFSVAELEGDTFYVPGREPAPGWQ